jgi:hypothetical protein
MTFDGSSVPSIPLRVAPPLSVRIEVLGKPTATDWTYSDLLSSKERSINDLWQVLRTFDTTPNCSATLLPSAHSRIEILRKSNATKWIYGGWSGVDGGPQSVASPYFQYLTGMICHIAASYNPPTFRGQSNAIEWTYGERSVIKRRPEYEGWLLLRTFNTSQAYFAKPSPLVPSDILSTTKSDWMNIR